MVDEAEIDEQNSVFGNYLSLLVLVFWDTLYIIIH